MKESHISATFVNTSYVDETYHQLHPQLIHLHNDVLELLYFTKGKGSYIVNGQSYDVSRGNLIICNQSTLHGEIHTSKKSPALLESYCCVLKGVHVPGLPENTLVSDELNPVLFFDYDRQPVENIMIALHQLHNTSDKYSYSCSLMANALLNIVYIKLANQEEAEKPVPQTVQGEPSRSRRDFIRDVTKYLDKHYMEPVSLMDISDAFFISHHHLSHLFKAETGLSPMKYVMHLRIGESQRLLMNTNKLISEICSEVGFEDNCYFSSTFKKYVGLTPSEYRKHFREND